MQQAVETKRRPGVFRNSAVNVAGIATAHGLSALAGLVTANVLGASGVGVLAVSFGLVEFGRSLVSFTHAPSIMEYHRGSDARRVFGTSLTLKLVGSLLFVALLAALAPRLAAVFSLPTYAILLASVVLVLSAFYEIGSARLEADNRMTRRALLLATGPLVGLALVGGLALTGQLTLFTSILSTVAAVSVMGVAFFLQEPRLFLPHFDGRVASYLARYGSRIVAAGLLAQGLLWTDTFMVSYLLDNAATGVYNVVFQLTYLMVTASVAIGVALMPALSELAGRGADTTVGFQRGTLIALGMSALLSLGLLAGGRLVLGLYGAEFTAGYPALLVLLVFGMSASLAVPASSLLTVHGHAGWLTAASLAQLALNVPLNYLLITRIGIVGAATATTSVFLLGTLALWALVHARTGALPLSRAVIAEAGEELRGWWGRFTA